MQEGVRPLPLQVAVDVEHVKPMQLEGGKASGPKIVVAKSPVKYEKASQGLATG